MGTQISVRVPDELVRRLDGLAADRGVVWSQPGDVDIPSCTS